MNTRNATRRATLSPVGKACLVLAAALALPISAIAADEPDPHAHHHAAAAEEPDPHAHHHHAMAAASTAAPSQSRMDMTAKSLGLVRADGAAVDLVADLAAETRPVLLNFIFTTCTAICPVMSHVFSEVQSGLGADASKVRMVSISIDPEQDTPERLKAYAAQYGAGPQWTFYTGSAQGSVAVQRAFGAYRGDRMYHEARTFIRSERGSTWTRIDGLATPEALVAQARSALMAH
jgi:protein SCO1/2